MAKAKDIRPLVELRGPFTETLAQFTGEVISLLGALDIALKHGSIPPNVAKILRDNHDKVYRTLFGAGGE